MPRVGSRSRSIVGGMVFGERAWKATTVRVSASFPEILKFRRVCVHSPANARVFTHSRTAQHHGGRRKGVREKREGGKDANTGRGRAASTLLRGSHGVVVVRVGERGREGYERGYGREGGKEDPKRARLKGREERRATNGDDERRREKGGESAGREGKGDARRRQG